MDSRMSTDCHDLTSLVERLRQEQEFSLFYKTQIRQTIQDINRCCDAVFQSLWLTQCLGCGLDRTKTHQLQCVEWTWALEQVGYVEFVDAAKILRSSALIESYNKFLGGLLESPALLARVLVWVETEGRDSAFLISDLISVVYGHCMFQHDHALFLDLLRELLRHVVSSAATPRDLFSGVEPIFCRVLTEYCNQLADLQTFLVQAFEKPLSDVFLHDDYLEFDVNKAGTRYQGAAETAGGGDRLLDGSAFLFGEDLDNSCQHLARLTMRFIEGISRHADHFPSSLKLVLGSLKSLVRTKWPDVSPIELRRPVSSVLFGPMLGSTVVNPDSHGVCEMEVVVGPVVRYNLSQVASVLQGCAWVLERRGGKYPMQKVIKKMNTKLYCDLLDTVDGERSGELLELSSSLRGLKRTVYLTSQTQLNNLVGIVCEVADDLTRKPDSSPIRNSLRRLEMQLPQAMKQMANATPYSSPTHTSRSPTRSLRSSDTLDVGLGGKGGGHRKRVSADAGKFPLKLSKKRSNSTSNLSQIHVSVGGPGHSTSTRTATRSVSPNQMLYTHSEVILRLSPGGQNSRGSFQVPLEVLVLPISNDSASVNVSPRSQAAAQWDFALLSQDEFMQQHALSTSDKKSDSPSTKSTHHTSTSHANTPLHNSAHDHAPSPTHTPSTVPPTSPSMGNKLQGPAPCCPSPIPEMPNGLNEDGLESGPGLQNGMGSGSNSTNSILSPTRERWEQRSSGSGTGIRPRHLTGSDSSLNASRELSSSPQSVPKKRSFTVTSIENGKFELSPLRHRNHGIPSSPLPQSTSPVPVITTTPTSSSPPPVTSTLPPAPPLTNGEVCPPLPSPSSPSTHLSDSRRISNPPISPNREHLTTSWHSSDQINPTKNPRDLSPLNPDLSASDLDRPSSDADTPNVGSSVENLIEGQSSATPKGSGKEAKRKRWTRFKRKKKDKKKLKTQTSLQEEEGESKKTEILGTKKRSKSDFDILDGAAEHEEVKLRRETHDALEFEDELQSSTRAVFKKRRSYTILDKYYALVLEQRKKEGTPKMIPKEEVESLPRFTSLRVRDMDSATFRQSLFCNQLEYKLRAALQNIHTPLPSNPVLRKEDFKYQLTSLLRCALQRSKWFHDDMETALLTETLTMVDKLSNTLVGVALESAHKEHQKRQVYTSYLVQSHMKFLDVRLQVGAIQTAVDRRHEVLKEQFVQFAVRQFLDSQTDQLAELLSRMTSLFLADERCSLMKRRVEAFTETLLEDQTWSYWPSGNSEMVSNYLEDQLFLLVYPHVFQPNMDVDKEKDEIFSSHLSSLSDGLTPAHRMLQISPIYHSGCPWLSAQKHLQAMSLFKSPRGKVHCIAESCRVLISLLQYAKVGSPPGADDLFPVLVYILIKANPPKLLSTTQYIRNFLEDDLIGEESYWWVQFSTAVEFTKTIE